MKRDLISARDLCREDLERYLDLAARVEAMPARAKRDLLAGYILMVMFAEPSTRTRLSFEAAMHRLGGGVIGFSSAEATSLTKGESFLDTVHTVESYADALVIRHPMEGTARLAAEASRLPVINAGDGTNQHPSQTLLDLYTIHKDLGRLSDFRIALVGDLKYSRTVHSLVQALRLFDGVSFTLVSPESLRLPGYLTLPDARGPMEHQVCEDLVAALPEADVIYMTRIQRERFPDLVDYEKVRDSYRLEAAMLSACRPHAKVLHPLPRVNEIAPDVDRTPHAGYFEQVANGVIMRQAILLDLLEVTV